MFPVVTVVVKLVLADVVAVSLAVVLWLVVAQTESELLPVEDAVVVADDDAVTDAELVWLEDALKDTELLPVDDRVSEAEDVAELVAEFVADVVTVDVSVVSAQPWNTPFCPASNIWFRSATSLVQSNRVLGKVPNT